MDTDDIKPTPPQDNTKPMQVMPFVKCSVNLIRLTRSEIDKYLPVTNAPSPDKQEDQHSNEDMDINDPPGMKLRTRTKPSFKLNNRPVRKTIENVSYEGLDTNPEESSDDDTPVRHYGKVRPSLSGLSKNRLRAQELINKVRQPISPESTDSSDGTSINNSSDSVSSEATVELSDVNDTENRAKQEHGDDPGDNRGPVGLSKTKKASHFQMRCI